MNHRLDGINILFIIMIMRRTFVSRNRVVHGIKNLDAAGSKVEKISGIIQDSDWFVYWGL